MIISFSWWDFHLPCFGEIFNSPFSAKAWYPGHRFWTRLSEVNNTFIFSMLDIFIFTEIYAILIFNNNWYLPMYHLPELSLHTIGAYCASSNRDRRGNFSIRINFPFYRTLPMLAFPNRQYPPYLSFTCNKNSFLFASLHCQL